MATTLPANLAAAADSPDLIAAAQRDGDALHRELASRLSLAEELADRLGSGAYVQDVETRLSVALRRMHDTDRRVAQLEEQVDHADVDDEAYFIGSLVTAGGAL